MPGIYGNGDSCYGTGGGTCGGLYSSYASLTEQERLSLEQYRIRQHNQQMDYLRKQQLQQWVPPHPAYVNAHLDLDVAEACGVSKVSEFEWLRKRVNEILWKK